MPRPTPVAVPRADVTMLAEVRAGLGAVQKKLPSKYFYDRRGSELFEEITRQPEYYPTRTERSILAEWAPSLFAHTRSRTLVELGAGSASKTRILLDAMQRNGAAVTYVPVDVSASFLDAAAAAVRADLPGVDVRPLVADITGPMALPGGLPEPVMVAFLGSTIGNFHSAAAVKLVRRVHAALRPDDRFLLGADLRKDRRRLVAAYNDAAGVTAEFNRNILRVLNTRLGADFDVEAFEHRAFYNRTARRIEMHLVSGRRQAVTIPGIGVVDFDEGETIRTEISCKYDRQAIADLFGDSGLRLAEWRTDPNEDFAVALGAPLPVEL